MKELLIALAIAHGLDGGTTAVNISSGVPEANPLRPRGAAANVVFSVGAGTAQIVALHALATRKPRAAKALGVLAVALEATAVGWNLRAHLDATRRR